MKKLDIEQAEPIREKFAPDWEIRKGKYLYKKVAFDDYNQALRFFMVIEKPQIKLDHFADIGFFYNEVILMVYTHDVSGLTQLDFELALYIDDALRQMGARQLEEGRLKSKAYKKAVKAAAMQGKRPKKKLKTKFSENFAKAAKEDLLAYKRIIGLAKKAYETNEIDPYFYDAVKITFDMNLYKKNPKLLSTLLKVGRKLAKEDWPMIVQDIKKNTGIDLEAHISENFADGKKKGKSRPGRVKKSGASCNGSVTSLRKKAAKYSGERGRMYHWCANMKSGRKKK